MITLHGVFPTAFVAIGNLNTKHIASVEMHLSMYFKDDKVRFDPPIMDKMVCVQGEAVRNIVFANGVSILGSGDITLFNKKGEAKKEKTVDSLNNFINSEVNKIIDYIKNSKNSNW
jgi:hypothetical protein